MIGARLSISSLLSSVVLAKVSSNSRVYLISENCWSGSSWRMEVTVGMLMGCILWKALSRLRRAGLSSISPKIYSLRCSCSRNCRMSSSLRCFYFWLFNLFLLCFLIFF